MATGPPSLIAMGCFAAAVSWTGSAFRIWDSDGECRGTYSCRPAAEAGLIAVAEEWLAVDETWQVAG